MHRHLVIYRHTSCLTYATYPTLFQVEGSSDTTEKVKKSLSSFLGVITDTLAPPQDMTIDCDVITLVATPAGTTEVYDSTKVRMFRLCLTNHRDRVIELLKEEILCCFTFYCTYC